MLPVMRCLKVVVGVSRLGKESQLCRAITELATIELRSMMQTSLHTAGVCFYVSLLKLGGDKHN